MHTAIRFVTLSQFKAKVVFMAEWIEATRGSIHSVE